MRKLITLATVVFTALIYAQTTTNQAFLDVANTATSTNINAYLDEFQKLGVKTTGSAVNTNALTWLKNKYTSFGYASTDLVEHSFTTKVGTKTYSGKNLIVTKTGTGTNKTKFIIVCGHYDTVTGAGTNDNGSGVSAILELARIMKNIPTDYSIKFINFSGEEQGLLGSKAYVSSTIVPSKTNTYFVLNIDEIGGVAGLTNNTITCENDQTSAGGTTNNTTSNTITQQLATYMQTYSGLKTKIASAYASDYMPFEAKGYVITGLFETNETTHRHKATDTKANMDPNYVTTITKGLVGAVQHFSGASTTTTTARVKAEVETTEVYPNPATDFVNIRTQGKISKIEIFDSLGKKLLESSTKEINISSLPKGEYIISYQINNKTHTQKILKK